MPMKLVYVNQQLKSFLLSADCNNQKADLFPQSHCFQKETTETSHTLTTSFALPKSIDNRRHREEEQLLLTMHIQPTTLTTIVAWVLTVVSLSNGAEMIHASSVHHEGHGPLLEEGRQFLRATSRALDTTVQTLQFSDEIGNNRGDCPLLNGVQYFVNGLSCEGPYCDLIQLTCSNTNGVRVNVATSESAKISEETANGGLGECPGTNEIVTGARCEGANCDNLYLTCQQLTYVALDYNNCAETATFPSTISTAGSGSIPDGSFFVGVQCYEDYCGKKAIKFCYPVQSNGGAITVTTPTFSDEIGNNHGECPLLDSLQTIMAGLSCSGPFCDDLQMTCYNNGSLQVNSAETESMRISEETPNNGLGECGTDQVITKIRCQGLFCDNLYLTCQKLTSVTLDYNSCSETSRFPSNFNQDGSGSIPDGSYAIGIRCSESYCGRKTIKYCYPVQSSGGGAVTVTTPTFSDETGNNQGECPFLTGLQTIMTGLSCRGPFCDILQMTCSNDGSLQVNLAEAESMKISDETSNNGLGECPGMNEVITKIRCQGLFCDNLYLTCQKLTSVTLDYNTCSETAAFPSNLGQYGSRIIPDGSYAVGLRCSQGYCGKKTIKYCYQNSGAVTVTTKAFSDETGNNQGACPTANGLQTIMTGLSCRGPFCDILQMNCYNDGSMQLDTVEKASGVISEETSNNGLGECPGLNEVITKITCQGKFCDNLYLTCQKLTSATLNYNSCSETSTFPSIINQDGSGSIPAGAYAIGLRCAKSYCGLKTLRYCYPVGVPIPSPSPTTASPTTAKPTTAKPTTVGPTVSPTVSPTLAPVKGTESPTTNPPPQSPWPYRAFATGLELKDAVANYVKDPSPNSVLAQEYGHPIGKWDVSQVSDFSYVFEDQDTFNEDISKWDTSSASSFRYLFFHARAFNQPLNDWNTAGVTDMWGVFASADSFNQPLDKWNVESVTDMRKMFRNATAFNSAIEGWTIKRVTTMRSMFVNAFSFNQPLEDWDVSSVTNMRRMFWNATSFNQPLDRWDVSSTTLLPNMLNGATSFRQDLCSWGPKLPFNRLDNCGLCSMFYATACPTQRDPVLRPGGNNPSGPFCFECT